MGFNITGSNNQIITNTGVNNGVITQTVITNGRVSQQVIDSRETYSNDLDEKPKKLGAYLNDPDYKELPVLFHVHVCNNTLETEKARHQYEQTITVRQSSDLYLLHVIDLDEGYLFDCGLFPYVDREEVWKIIRNYGGSFHDYSVYKGIDMILPRKRQCTVSFVGNCSEHSASLSINNKDKSLNYQFLTGYLEAYQKAHPEEEFNICRVIHDVLC